MTNRPKTARSRETLFLPNRFSLDVPRNWALIYYFFPYGLLSLLIIPIIVLFGLWQHRSAAISISGNQLTMRFRGFSLQTAYLMKKRIQSMKMKKNYFHKRKQVATIVARIKSGMGVFKAQVSHMDEVEAEQILSWYGKNTKASIADAKVGSKTD